MTPYDRDKEWPRKITLLKRALGEAEMLARLLKEQAKVQATVIDAQQRRIAELESENEKLRQSSDHVA